VWLFRKGKQKQFQIITKSYNMFGSKILEVVIGIIFIFLLYSLLVTAIQEILSSFLFLRARMLRKTIRRMLMDSKSLKCKKRNKGLGKRLLLNLEYTLSFFFPFMQRFCKSEDNFATLFYEQPSIKYIGLSNWYKRPSYIKPENFAKTIADILIYNTNENISDSQKITATLNTNAIIYKHKTISIDTETLGYIQSLWRDAKEDVEQFKILLSNWFQETMDRLTGSYKRKTQMNVFIIGFIIAFVFNVDAISITNKLSKDDNARAELAQLASNYVATHDKNSVSIDATDTTNTKTRDTMVAEVQKVFSLLREDVSNSNNLMAIGWDIPENFNKSIKIDSIIKRNEAAKGKKRKTKINVCQQCIQEIYKQKVKREPVNEDTELNPIEKIKYVKCVAIRNKSLVGILITAIAISLGAPFWFDLLGKFMKLRSTNTPTKKEEEVNN